MRSHSLYPVFTWVILGHLKKCSGSQIMDLKKTGKVGRVLIFCFYFQSNLGRVFIFSSLKATQTSSILLFWQTNNTIVFPTDTSYFRSKLTKRLLFSPTSFMSVKSPTNILDSYITLQLSLYCQQAG